MTRRVEVTREKYDPSGGCSTVRHITHSQSAPPVCGRIKFSADANGGRRCGAAQRAAHRLGFGQPRLDPQLTVPRRTGYMTCEIN